MQILIFLICLILLPLALRAFVVSLPFFLIAFMAFAVIFVVSIMTIPKTAPQQQDAATIAAIEHGKAELEAADRLQREIDARAIEQAKAVVRRWNESQR